jgi:transposase-like protein
MTLARVTLRELSAEERQALGHLASSRTAQARLVERARNLLAIADGRRPAQVAQDLGVSRPTIYTRIHRFKDRGLRGLEDQPRAGRPHTYTAEQRAEVIAAGLTDPKRLGLPSGLLDARSYYAPITSESFLSFRPPCWCHSSMSPGPRRNE